ncbi:hypothetical protein ACIRG4_35190 [Streptomyces sp. NPDC102395]|uniref:hypothetical protein n=1 Tax=Streptomyces sp. NPDC102395 TaxID=3366168 RepID=UPI0037FF3098
MTIVVSVVGLFLTGIGTLMGALVSADQLDQSKEASERNVRAQAARVSAWLEQQGDGKWRLHLRNASVDPIGDVRWVFADHHSAVGLVATSWRVALPDVPPCTEQVIDQKQLWRNPGGGVESEFFQVPSQDQPTVSGWRNLEHEDANLVIWAIGFRDRDGVAWVREDGRLLKKERIASSPAAGAIVQGLPTVRPAQACADATAEQGTSER